MSPASRRKTSWPSQADARMPGNVERRHPPAERDDRCRQSDDGDTGEEDGHRRHDQGNEPHTRSSQGLWSQ